MLGASSLSAVWPPPGSFGQRRFGDGSERDYRAAAVLVILLRLPPFLQALGQEALYARFRRSRQGLGLPAESPLPRPSYRSWGHGATIVREVIAPFPVASGADAGAAKLGHGQPVGGHAFSGICSGSPIL
jgi:hypothetical protein